MSMDKTKIKVASVIEDYEYNCISAIIDGRLTSFVLDKDISVAGLEGKSVNLSVDEKGAYQITQ
jgi:hypothetical protein